MTKYDSKFKIKVVSRYLKGGISYRDLCAKFNISSMGIPVRWVHQAKTHGIESLKVNHTRKQYSQTFKITVVEYVYTHQTSRALTAAHFGISASQVNSWDRIVREQGVVGLRTKHKGRPAAVVKHKKNKSIKRLEPTKEEQYQQEILKLKSQLHKAELDRDILKTFATLTKSSPKHFPRK